MIAEPTSIPMLQRPPDAAEHPFLPPGWTMKKLRGLHEMIDAHTRRMSDYRANTVRIVEYCVGRYFNGGQPAKISRPINALRLAIQTVAQRVGTSVPKAAVWAGDSAWMPHARKLEIVLNRRLASMRLEEFQERAIFEAMVGFAMAKVTCRAGEYVDVEGQMLRRYEPTVELVDTEDAIIDIAAKSMDKVRFIGNRYMASVDEVVSEQDYDETARDYVRRMGASSRHDGPVPWEQRPIGASMAESWADDSDLDEQVRIMDVYLPREKWMLTLVVGADHIPPLYGREWKACRPFIPLVFESVPGTVLPVPPARHWFDIARQLDAGYSKLINQFRRQKTVLEVPGGSADDVARLNDTPDGEGYRKDSPMPLNEVRYGGPDQVNFAFAVHLKSVASMVLANYEMLVGSDANAQTATEASIMSSGAHGFLGAIERHLRSWWSDIMRSVAWFVHNDWMEQPRLDIGRPELGISLPVVWSYEDRVRADFFDFMFDIKPFTTRNITPEAKLSSIVSILQQIYGMLLQDAAAQGVRLDVAEVLRIAGSLTDLEPEMRRIIRSVDPSGVVASQETAPVRPNIPRVYTHRQAPSTATREGAEAQLVNMLMMAKRNGD